MKNEVQIRINTQLFKTVLWSVPIFLILCFAFLHKADYGTYCAVVSEDNVVEYATSLLYLGSSFLSVLIAVNFYKQKLLIHSASYLMLALGTFMFFGEEISWGQRLLDFELSGYFLEHNLQKETNLHNLDTFKGLARWFYIIVGLYGGCFWMISTSVKKRFNSKFSYYVPGWYLSSYFIVAAIYYTYLFYIRPHYSIDSITWREQEPSEMLLSLGFFVFILINRYRQIQDLNLPSSKIFSISTNSVFVKE